MKVKRMGITEILRGIWLFSANKIKTSESVSKKSFQLKLELNSSLWQKLDTPFHNGHRYGKRECQRKRVR